MSSRLMRCSAACLVVVLLALPARADDVKVERLEVQTRGDDTFFYVRVACPDDCLFPKFNQVPVGRGWFFAGHVARQAHLIPQDDKTSAVYSAMGWPAAQSPPLEFVGKLHGRGEARFLLTYPLFGRKPGPGEESFRANASFTVDFARAKTRRPPEAPERVPRDDLKRLWGEAQATRFATLEAMTDSAGFYTFAREATNRKYSVGVKSTRAEPSWWGSAGSGFLYENITGATAIAETLQTERMLRTDAGDKGPRRIDVATLRGIDVAEHPWEKMLDGKKPAVEPLAGIAPHDNYWLHFKDLQKLVEAKELLAEWGGTGLQTLNPTRRDTQVLTRYEKQLCLRLSPEAALVGRLLVKGVAFTGSDLAFGEGTDVTLLFHVTDSKTFLAAVEPGLAAARKEFGDDLKTAKDEYRGVTVESFVTLLREVSLHRAAFGEFVVWSNSAVAVRRVLDVAKGNAKSLAESLDYRYMRTVYKADDKGEDGFAFLSDAFIRRLVGPATKIKEKRRLEALTSLRLATNAALFTAWETGSLPANQKALLAGSGLKAAELEVPEGRAVAWDAGRRLAVSEVYGTIHFATPLIELPIDRVTEEEARRYEWFRQDYFRLWRQYFDPIGMRLALDKNRVRWDVFILPLVENSAYNQLRDWAGGDTVRVDPAHRPAGTLVDFVAHINPRVVPDDFKKSLGEKLFLRVGSNSVTRRLLTREVQAGLTGGGGLSGGLVVDAIVEAKDPPLLLGLAVGELKEPEKLMRHFLADDRTTRRKDDYRGVAVFQTPYPFLGEFHHGHLGDDWVLCMNEDFFKDQIDTVLAAGGRKAPEGEEAADVHLSLFLALCGLDRAEMGKTAAAWNRDRALDNCAFWYGLYRCGVLPREKCSEDQRRAAALQYFGFVPVGPDGVTYDFDPIHDEVVTIRYGSPTRPTPSPEPDPVSPVTKLIDGLSWLRADLRFRDDGVQTTVIIERQPSRK